MATAFWVEAPASGALREELVADAQPGEVRVRTLYTGVSRGTESLVFRGEVPETERERMRAPFQQGDFPGPVKYGYLNVGTIEQGPEHLRGRTVFALYPHQSSYVVPERSIAVVPDGVPPRRAVLAGAVETAVNILWDAAPLVGDRLMIVGAGMIGCALARVACGIPGLTVTVVDVDRGKADVCGRLGVTYAHPGAAPVDQDVVIDTSGSGDGLQLAIESAATEGQIIEASWFGDRSVTLQLGGDFHSRRLTIRSSQVGMVSPRRRGTRSTADRLELALRLLQDPGFDHLLTGESSWRDLPAVMARIAAGSSPGLCHTIDWRDSA
ncbi:zinc-dependent alcohol dehydrogenase [Microbacterium gallinarum]|uniref:Zinc-binding alcohol dehydrogenase n=1 Tax=Microbacterium gallinarum TaxID=2762209 RepID=A0ABR8X0X7_9MICO|nr:zinc-binding alcohol dehydrogenase [Microbacterium gallinarum]MBD8022843.1 zinc-binding alcohol dehydrogenase [Microbacterium gallinarum]